MTPIEALSDALYRSYVSGGTTPADRDIGARDAFHRAAEQMLAHLEEAGWQITSKADDAKRLSWPAIRDQLCRTYWGHIVERQHKGSWEEGVAARYRATIWQSDLGL